MREEWVKWDELGVEDWGKTEWHCILRTDLKKHCGSLSLCIQQIPIIGG